MTKAQRILQLAATMPDDRTMTRRIAAIVGTTDSYVRTVVRQRKGRWASEAEIRYLDSSLGKASRARSNRAFVERKKRDPEWVARVREYHRAYRARRKQSASLEATQ